MNKTSNKPVPVYAAQIDKSIFVIRKKRVMLDAHLAKLYGVPTGRLVEAVKRKENRFPEDFMFQLRAEEANIRNQEDTHEKSGACRKDRERDLSHPR